MAALKAFGKAQGREIVRLKRGWAEMQRAHAEEALQLEVKALARKKRRAEMPQTPVQVWPQPACRRRCCNTRCFYVSGESYQFATLACQACSDSAAAGGQGAGPQEPPRGDAADAGAGVL